VELPGERELIVLKFLYLLTLTRLVFLVEILFSRIGYHEGGCYNHGEQFSKYVPN
jgi:hypothetical protein